MKKVDLKKSEQKKNIVCSCISCYNYNYNDKEKKYCCSLRQCKYTGFKF